MGTAQSKEEKGSILLSKMCCCVEYEPTPGSWADPSAALTMDDTHVTEAGMTMQYKQGEAPPTSQPVAPESTIQIQGTLKTNEEEEEKEEEARRKAAAAAAAAREEAEEEEAARAALAARREELEAVRREREGLERQLRAASADAERVEEARAWVLSVLGETFREGSTGDLEDGILLCKLVEAVRRGAAPAAAAASPPPPPGPPAAAALSPPPPGPPGPGGPSSSPEHGAADRGFSVAFFLQQCRAVGVPEEDLFEEADLAEGGRGLPAVATCLLALRTIYDRRRLSSESGKTTVSSKKQSWEKSPASSPSAPPEGQEGGRAPAPALTPVAPEAAVEPTPRVGATPPPASPPAAAIEPTPPAEATIEAAVLPPQALAAERAPAPAEAAAPPSSPPPPVTPPPVTPPPAASPPAAATPGGGGGGASGVPVRTDGSANARRAANYYNPEDKVDDVRWWVETVTGQTLPDPDFITNLKDGVVLCKLVNAIKPGTIKKINENTKVAFRLMENITNFGRACKALGVPEHDVFDTADLWEEKEPRLVVKTIYALGRTIQVTVPEFNGPTLGPRLAQRNERTFSPEQLQESQRKAVMSGVTAGSWGTQGMASLRASGARPHQAGGVTFGAEHAGIGDSSVLSRFSMGSQQTMERPEASAGRNISPPPHAGLKKK